MLYPYQRLRPLGVAFFKYSATSLVCGFVPYRQHKGPIFTLPRFPIFFDIRNGYVMFEIDYSDSELNGLSRNALKMLLNHFSQKFLTVKV